MAISTEQHRMVALPTSERSTGLHQVVCLAHYTTLTVRMDHTRIVDWFRRLTGCCMGQRLQEGQAPTVQMGAGLRTA